MKKLNYLLLGLAGLSLASCSNDDFKFANGDGVQVTINLPGELNTRAGEAGNYLLTFAVYDTEGNLIESDTQDFTGNKTSVNLKLLTGKEYTLAFFAQDAANAIADNRVYTFDPSSKSVSVAYSKMNNSDENNSGVYDCFYGSKSEVTANSTGLTVTLYRPLAQINWGTNDLDAASVEQIFGEGGAKMYATLKTDAYSQFDIMTGELLGDAEEVTLGVFTAPDATFPVAGGYNYIGMQYVLAGQTTAVYDLTLNVSNTDVASTGESTDIVVTSAPLKANYRTNIYGSLFTDTYNIQVELGDWGGSILDPQETGEQIAEGLYLNSTSKTYTITSEAGLQNMVAESAKQSALQNYKIILNSDLDMSSVKNYTPLDLNFATFDGQGHTISNLTVTGTDQVAFCNELGKIQNLNFKNATITGNHYVAVVSGYGSNVQINNVTVDGAKITCTAVESGDKYDDGDKAGAIVGYLVGDSNATASVTNCSVNNITITAYREVGSVIGYVNISEASGSYTVVENNKATNCTVTANQQLPNGGEYVSVKSPNAGEIYGYTVTSPNITLSNNTATDVSVITTSSTGQTTATVTSQAAFVSAAKAGNATITLEEGNYNFPAGPVKNVTVNGVEGTVIVFTRGYTSQYDTVTFNNITFQGGNEVDNYFGIQGQNINYNNCTFYGLTWNYSTNMVYDTCTFYQNKDEYCAWTYSANNLTYKDCTFNCYNKGLLLYNEQNSSSPTLTINVENCTFKASNPEENKAAIMINGGSPFNLNISKSTETDFEMNSISKSALWGLKTESAIATVTLDGTEVYNNK